MLINRQVLLAEAEANYGVSPAPTAADNAILVENISWSNEGLRMQERPVVKTSFGKLPHVYGGSLRTLSFDVELKGGGLIGNTQARNAPEFDPLLQACGFGRTVVANTSHTYLPASSGIKSCYLTFAMDGSVFSLSGARGSCSLAMESGAIPKLSFTMTGHYVDMAALALPAPVYSGVVPKPAVDMGWQFKVGAGALVDIAVGINAFSLELGNTVSQVPDMGASDGFGEVQITGRDVTGSIDPESLVYTNANAADVLFRDPYKFIQDNSTFQLEATHNDGVAGQEVVLSMPKCALRELSGGEREGIQTYEFSFGCAEDAGDDEVSFVFK